MPRSAVARPRGAGRAASDPPLPYACGPLTDHLLQRLGGPPAPLGPWPSVAAEAEVWSGTDFQLALYVCYELHYRSFAGVDPRWEWYPGLLEFRAELEEVFEDRLAALVGPVRGEGTVEEQLWALATGGGPVGPSLSGTVEGRATLGQVRELAVHRSAYQLKEADPHTWAIPRLTGGPKAALVEIQADEYGGGKVDDMHASLFAVTMAELGLDSRYGTYLDWLPGVTLATVNLISLFGLHRRLRAALVGHLAIFEMTSVGPMGRYSRGMERLGLSPAGRRFYDVHVLADTHHQHVAAGDMAGALAVDEPELAHGILFGARAVMAVEGMFSRYVLECWDEGRTSLRRAVPAPAPAGV